MVVVTQLVFAAVFKVLTVCMFLLLVSNCSSADKFMSCARLMNMITRR